MVMAKEVDALAKKTPGKRSLAIEAFSRALLAIPTIIADNAGLDSAELISQLRAEHQKEGCTAGIDVISGSVSIETKSLVNLFSDYYDVGYCLVSVFSWVCCMKCTLVRRAISFVM